MLHIYPAIFHKENNNYWVEFPDLEGCHTFGNSLKETAKSAQEAIDTYIETLLKQGKELPEPTNISDIVIDENSIISLITCKTTT